MLPFADEKNEIETHLSAPDNADSGRSAERRPFLFSSSSFSKHFACRPRRRLSGSPVTSIFGTGRRNKTLLGINALLPFSNATAMEFSEWDVWLEWILKKAKLLRQYCFFKKRLNGSQLHEN